MEFRQRPWLKIKISKNWNTAEDERALITATYLPVAGKPLYLSACEWRLKTHFYHE